MHMLEWVKSTYNVHILLSKTTGSDNSTNIITGVWAATNKLSLICLIQMHTSFEKQRCADVSRCCTEQVYLDVPVCEQQVDDDVDWEALHVVQSLLDAAQLSSQLHASVQLPSLTDLVQDRLSEILAVREENR